MQLRRERILDAAREIMATEGFEALSIRDLARRAGVTTPTIYNLVGNKTEILRQVMEGVFERFEHLQEQSDSTDPLSSAENIINQITLLLTEEENFYRAAMMANDRLRQMEGKPVADGLARGVEICVKASQDALDGGVLKGNIDSMQLGEHIYNCYLMARQEWVNGAIDSDTLRKQALTGLYVAFAADATTKWHKVLMSKISNLG